MATAPTFVDGTPAKNETFQPGATVEIPEGADGEVDASTDGFVARMKGKYFAVKKFKDDRLSSLRPWSEFLDRSKFSTPGKLEAFSRINKNLSTFYSNYVVVTALISVYVLFSNFLFLTAMIFSCCLYYWTKLKSQANEPVTIGNREFTVNQVNGFLAVFTLFMFLYTNGSSTVFWLVTMALLSVFGHAAGREPIEGETGNAAAFVAPQFL